MRMRRKRGKGAATARALGEVRWTLRHDSMEAARNTPIYENKQAFVTDLTEGFIQNGAGRYDYLMDNAPWIEERDGSSLEILHFTGRSWNVTGDSLTSIANTLIKQF